MGGQGSKEVDQRVLYRRQQIHHIRASLSRINEAPFENLVFEGGGSKGMAYFGALKALEEVGVLVHVKRYAGTSTGAFWAMFLSVALSPSGIAAKIPDAASIYDSKLRIFGWHALNNVEKVLRKVIGDHTGKADITFKEVYERYSKELCILATNLTTSRLEYFHPKTTPDVAIVDAAIMAATPPGLAKQRYLLRGNKKHYFVDGGVLCNFPIHSFDGWYLSMKKEDSFLSRLGLGAADPPFKGYNPNTLGLLLVTPGEDEFGEKEFLRRLDYETVPRPPTKLAKLKGSVSEDKWQRVISRDRTMQLGERLLAALRGTASREGQITLQEFQTALNSVGGSDQDLERLFGYNSVELAQMFEDIEREREGTATLEQVLERVHQQGRSLHQPTEGTTSLMAMNNVSDFFKAVMSAMKVNNKQVYMKDIDIFRTIGINTDYVGPTDHLQNGDKQFLILQGEIACIAALLEFIRSINAPERPQEPRSQNNSPSRLSTPPAADMRDYTVPAGLYPSLPPSYEDVIGQSSTASPDIHPLQENDNNGAAFTGLYPDLLTSLEPQPQSESSPIHDAIPPEKLGIPPSRRRQREQRSSGGGTTSSRRRAAEPVTSQTGGPAGNLQVSPAGGLVVFDVSAGQSSGSQGQHRRQRQGHGQKHGQHRHHQGHHGHHQGHHGHRQGHHGHRQGQCHLTQGHYPANQVVQPQCTTGPFTTVVTVENPTTACDQAAVTSSIIDIQNHAQNSYCGQTPFVNTALPEPSCQLLTSQLAPTTNPCPVQYPYNYLLQGGGQDCSSNPQLQTQHQLAPFRVDLRQPARQ